MRVGDELVNINGSALYGSRQEALILIKGSYRVLKIVVRRYADMDIHTYVDLSCGHIHYCSSNYRGQNQEISIGIHMIRNFVWGRKISLCRFCIRFSLSWKGSLVWKWLLCRLHTSLHYSGFLLVLKRSWKVLICPFPN